MENGIIYVIFNFIIENLKYLNLVELFKYVAQLINPNPSDHQDAKNTFERNAVDLFIILKWLLIAVIWKLNINSNFFTVLVWYLLIANIYTYFYYHVWDKVSLNTESFLIDRIRRRFITLMQSIFFSNICFAYLYNIPYRSDFTWSAEKPEFTKSIWFSISNSLAANYEEVCAFSDFGNNVTMVQLIITFLFITIILGKSIPQTTSTT
jgi:hypothetical protein